MSLSCAVAHWDAVSHAEAVYLLQCGKEAARRNGWIAYEDSGEEYKEEIAHCADLALQQFNEDISVAIVPPPVDYESDLTPEQAALVASATPEQIEAAKKAADELYHMYINWDPVNGGWEFDVRRYVVDGRTTVLPCTEIARLRYFKELAFYQMKPSPAAVVERLTRQLYDQKVAECKSAIYDVMLRGEWVTPMTPEAALDFANVVLESCLSVGGLHGIRPKPDPMTPEEARARELGDRAGFNCMRQHEDVSTGYPSITFEDARDCVDVAVHVYDLSVIQPIIPGEPLPEVPVLEVPGVPLIDPQPGVMPPTPSYDPALAGADMFDWCMASGQYTEPYCQGLAALVGYDPSVMIPGITHPLPPGVEPGDIYLPAVPGIEIHVPEPTIVKKKTSPLIWVGLGLALLLLLKE